jgi:hypothetical protein
MIHETQVTLTQTELTTIQILCTEFIRRDAQGIHSDLHKTERTRQIWLTSCGSIVAKTNNALTHCLVTNEQAAPINY